MIAHTFSAERDGTVESPAYSGQKPLAPPVPTEQNQMATFYKTNQGYFLVDMSQGGDNKENLMPSTNAQS
jgi:hypothetical protein